MMDRVGRWIITRLCLGGILNGATPHGFSSIQISSGTVGICKWISGDCRRITI